MLNGNGTSFVSEYQQEANLIIYNADVNQSLKENFAPTQYTNRYKHTHLTNQIKRTYHLSYLSWRMKTNGTDNLPRHLTLINNSPFSTYAHVHSPFVFVYFHPLCNSNNSFTSLSPASSLSAPSQLHHFSHCHSKCQHCTWQHCF